MKVAVPVPEIVGDKTAIEWRYISIHDAGE
jgi:hypothetical protein